MAPGPCPMRCQGSSRPLPQVHRLASELEIKQAYKQVPSPHLRGCSAHCVSALPACPQSAPPTRPLQPAPTRPPHPPAAARPRPPATPARRSPPALCARSAHECLRTKYGVQTLAP